MEYLTDLRPSGATTFIDYAYLTLIESADTLKVNYNLMHYSRGKEQRINGPDNHFKIYN